MTQIPTTCVFQGHVYSLIGALADDRFALMHAGYKHTQGTDGFPKDLNMAYGYYSNAGAQTSVDTSRGHENKVSIIAQSFDEYKQYYGKSGGSNGECSSRNAFRLQVIVLVKRYLFGTCTSFLTLSIGSKLNYNQAVSLALL